MCVKHGSGVDIKVGTNQTRPWLVVLRRGVDEVAVALLGQLAVLWVAGEITQTLPLHNQRSDGRGAICGASTTSWLILEEDAVIGDTARRVKGDFEVVTKSLSLSKNLFNLAGILDEMSLWTSEQVIS